MTDSLVSLGLLVELLNELQVLLVVDQELTEDEKEAVVVVALEGWGSNDHLGHKVKVLEFHGLWGLWPDTVEV